MDTYALESFIDFCDEMQIAQEGERLDNLKAKVVQFIAKIVDWIEGKVRSCHDSKIKDALMDILLNAKKLLSKSKSLQTINPEMAKKFETQATTFQEQVKEKLDNAHKKGMRTEWEYDEDLSKLYDDEGRRNGHGPNAALVRKGSVRTHVIQDKKGFHQKKDYSDVFNDKHNVQVIDPDDDMQITKRGYTYSKNPRKKK